jgi:FAD/FMN-containing dehydrogenase
MTPTLAELASSFNGRLLTAADDMAPFVTDWGHMRSGQALAVAQPDTTADVAAIMRWCAANKVPVVPQGGNTGLAGGCIPDQSGTALVLSLARMTSIRNIDPTNNTITLDAGCILQNVQEIADSHNRLFPLSLAAEGSCTIGGNLSTNAGGTGVLRYGNTRDLCLGLEVVTANGEIWDGLKSLRKDNTGYDLRDLYIGSEGSLGIITGAVMKLFPRPVGRATAILSLDSPARALDLFGLARRRLDTMVTGFEFFSEECLSLMLEKFDYARRPVETKGPWYTLIELSDLQSEDCARDNLQGLLELAFEENIISDGAVAASVAQARAFWALREGLAEAMAKSGKVIKHDVSVPISAVPQFLEEADTAVAQQWPDIRFIVFGHLGDGNIHYDFISAKGADQEAFYAQQDAINALVHNIVVKYRGSISAEHGLGTLRRDEADRYRDPVERALMRTIKTALDPHNLMNPGKLLA